jgi:hypothetical protein
MRKHISIFNAFFLIVLLLIIFSVAITKADDPLWKIVSIDVTGNIVVGSLALDSAGNPHISFSEFAVNGITINDSGNLMYTSQNGSSWSIQSIDQTIYRSHGNGESSLALDSQGNPHVAYQDYKGFLKYASWNGSNWNKQTVDPSIYTNGYPSLVLDSNGYPHISYSYLYVNPDDSNDISDCLKYAIWNGSVWNIQIVDQTNIGRYNCLVLDSTGNSHISYEGDKGLMYASWNGTDWDIQNIDQHGTDSSLVLDSCGNPHISYLDYDLNHDLKYASWNGTGWRIQAVTQNAGSGSLILVDSLALDSSGNPKIAYYDRGQGNIKFASWNGTNWNLQIISQTGENTFGGIGRLSLALDPEGNPHICYNTISGYIGHGQNTVDLKYAFALLNHSSGKDDSGWTVTGTIIAVAIVVPVMILVFGRLLYRKK